MKVQNPQHRLRFGDIDLIHTWSGGSIETLADDATFGNPQPVEVAIRSLLQDGSIVVTQNYDNREAFFRIKFKGADSKQLAELEARLFAAVGKRSTLTWSQFDGFGAPTVFDVVTSSVEVADIDDVDELNLQRVYGLRLVLLPFGRSEAEVSITSLGFLASPTTVDINTCGATTGWVGSPGAVSTTSGYVETVSSLSTNQIKEFSLTLTTAAVNMTTTPYLIIDWQKGGHVGYGTRPYRAYADGVELTKIADGTSPTGFRRTWFACPDTSITVIKFWLYLKGTFNGTARLQVDNVARTDSPPGLGSAKQRYQSVEIAGSARAQASIEISDPTDSLGDCLVYTSEVDAGLQPAMRKWKTSGGADTADVFLVSGARTPMAATDFVMDIPTQYLRESSYALMARTRTAAAGPAVITWSARARIGSTGVGPTVSGSASVLGGGSVWYISTLGSLELPTLKVPAGSAGLTRITLGTAHADMDVDEVWLFDLKNGALTQVACGTEPATAPAAGGASNRLWILPATLEQPSPQVLIGNASDMSDAHFPVTMESWGTHEVAPPIVSVFWVTSQAVASSMTIRHYPRWHTHAVS